MDLIDRDTIDDYLGKWADDFYENPENSDADFMDGYCMTLNRIYSSTVPVIEAIPVEWIKKHISEIGDNSTIAEAYNLLIEIWRAEQEKQNE